MARDGNCDIGLIGLAVMGENLALNIASRGYRIAVYNRTTSVTDAFVAGRGNQPNVVGCHSLADLVAALKPPRKVMMMVKAGPAVDQLIETLTPLLSPGDVLIYGGNTLYSDTERRTREVEAKGMLFVGTGVSGAKRARSRGRASCPAAHLPPGRSCCRSSRRSPPRWGPRETFPAVTGWGRGARAIT